MHYKSLTIFVCQLYLNKADKKTMTINPNEGNKKLELHLRIHTPTQLH